ncbi:unnamed protein product [Ectocarpus sp. 8 AP-2014]
MKPARKSHPHAPGNSDWFSERRDPCMGKMNCLQRTPAGSRQQQARIRTEELNPDVHPIITNNVFENLKEGQEECHSPPRAHAVCAASLTKSRPFHAQLPPCKTQCM